MLKMVLPLLSVTAAMAAIDARLANVTTVFVAGNNPAAYSVRNDLAKPSWRWSARGVPSKWCIALATNPATADAILEVAVPPYRPRYGLMSDEATATLTVRGGDMVWATKPMMGSTSILYNLNRDVCAAKAYRSRLQTVAQPPEVSSAPADKGRENTPTTRAPQPSTAPTDTRPRVKVTSAPSGASVDVEGYKAGTTPVDFPLEPGTYKLTVKKAGFVPWLTRINVEAGRPIEVAAELVQESKREEPPGDTRVVELPK